MTISTDSGRIVAKLCEQRTSVGQSLPISSFFPPKYARTGWRIRPHRPMSEIGPNQGSRNNCSTTFGPATEAQHKFIDHSISWKRGSSGGAHPSRHGSLTSVTSSGLTVSPYSWTTWVSSSAGSTRCGLLSVRCGWSSRTPLGCLWNQCRSRNAESSGRGGFGVPWRRAMPI